MLLLTPSISHTVLQEARSTFGRNQYPLARSEPKESKGPFLLSIIYPPTAQSWGNPLCGYHFINTTNVLFVCLFVLFLTTATITFGFSLFHPGISKAWMTNCFGRSGADLSEDRARSRILSFWPMELSPSVWQGRHLMDAVN